MSAPAKPYYLLGERALARIAAQIEPALGELAAQWWPQAEIPHSLAVRALEPAQIDALGRRARWLLRRGEQWLAIFCSDQNALQLAQGWLGCGAGAGELTKMLEQRFCGELFCALTGGAELPTTTANLDARDFPEAIARPGSGALVIDVQLGGASQKWVTTAGLWAELVAAPRAGAPNKLEPAAAALGACRVRVEARLAPVQIPLAEIAGLSAGDFLNLQHDLSGEVQLIGGDITLSLPAVLGRRGASKAVQISAIREDKP